MDDRDCIRCKNKADVVEKGKNYCVSCYFILFNDETIEEYEKRQNELEERRRKKYENNFRL
jgi:hypothetical protein